jgi:hypothetical protein
MKQFKQFRSEQEVINEIGPVGVSIMTAMGIFGGGVAAYKLFKKAKETIKGYKETKKEKKDNQDNGVYIDLKTWDDDAGKITTTPTLIAKAGTAAANMSNDERDKKQKEEQKKLDPENTRKQAQWEIKNKEKEEGDKEKKTKADAGKSVKDWMGTEVDKIPDGMKPKVKEKERKEIGGHKDVLAYMDRWEVDSVKGWKKWFDDPKDKDDFEYVDPKEWEKRYAKGGAAKFGQRPKIGESRLLKFGEFITEGVMDDLKKASKSRKDSEITLDDGADIPIDPLTASILVKYIEGLGSSEKNKIINKIQRTERAFMKVLGQAHGE